MDSAIGQAPPAEMVLIKGGIFTMGSDIDEIEKIALQFHSESLEWYMDETPAHIVQLEDFHIDKHETTVSQYRIYIEATGKPAPKFMDDEKFGKANHPIVGVTWLEDPLDYRPKAEGLKKLGPSVALPLVAGGDEYGEAVFEELVEVGGVSIIMQDVMRCGGAGVAARAGQWAAQRGVRTSCHSPFGPLSNLASAHVHAASPNAYALEHAVWENEWRADLVEPAEHVEGGHLRFPEGPGMGATLKWKTLERVGGKRWKV